MTSSHKFKSNVRHHGFTGKMKSPGRITFVIAALEAYEQSVKQHRPNIEQISYLYEVDKQCKKWLDLKNNKTTDKALSRWLHVNALRTEIPTEMAARFPDLWAALNTFERQKATPFIGQTRAAQAVYAHETAVYRSNKQNGQYNGGERMTASATQLHANLDHLYANGHKHHKAFANSSIYQPMRNGLEFKQLSEQQFRELDKVCRGQFNVLYLSKIQRLQYMVLFDNGLLKRPDGLPITLMPGEKVRTEMLLSIYAVDKYGNVFVTTTDNHAGRQINHTTLCAGNEVLCAGTMSIKQGVLRMISNSSGHYAPTTAHLQQALQLLHQSGVSMNNVVVRDYAQNSIDVTAIDFMNSRYRPIPDHIMEKFLDRTA